MVANKEGRQAYLHHDRLHHIIIPGILQSCQDFTQTIPLFPQTHLPAQTLPSTLRIIIGRPLPRSRTPNQNTYTHFTQNHFTSNNTNTPKFFDSTNTNNTRAQVTIPFTHQPLTLYETPKYPLTVLEIYGGTAAGLEALLKNRTLHPQIHMGRHKSGRTYLSQTPTYTATPTIPSTTPSRSYNTMG
jgi:hypothetical protein